jgi:tetratricopeptide (TPR) repeat protein
MRATMSGRFAEVESDAQAAFDLIGTYHREHAQQVFGAQLCSLRREQGRIAELEPVIIAAVEREPRAPMWRIALAMLYCELGRTERARPELERINLADVRMEPNFWLVTIALLAEAVAAVGDVGRAGVLYEILQPYSTLCVASADAVVFLGAAGRYLGLLAATMGRWDDAIRHFEEALAINEALKAPPLVARTKYNYASMLLARNGAGDRARSRALADGVVETARRLGMPLLLEQALALELNGRESNPTPMTADAVLRREDAFWTLGFAGSSGRLKDMKGLHYLAQLLRYPGRELHALDLVRTTEATASENLATARADGFEILDAEAKVAYRRRLAELREELDEAEEFNDSGRAERARLEIEAIGAQLSAAIGRGGRDRVSGSAAERARSTVTKRIKEALKRIAEVNVLLGDHFATRVKTGTFCVYIPDAAHPVRWELE